MEHMDLARKGELEAENYLSAKGFTIIERNWYHRQKELDLIAYDEDELVIIEVKTRNAPALDNPSMAIDRKKKRNLVIAANAFARKNKISKEIRFDVVWLVYRGDIAEIDYIKNAFVPGL